MQKNGPPGVWLCSTDMVLTCSDVAIDWSCVKDGLLICSICDPHYAANHGAVKVNSDGVVSSILYCGTLQALRDYTLTDGTVLMSLFFDFLVAMAEDVIQDTFVSGHYGHCYDQKFSLEKRTMAQRTQTVVWKELSPCTLKTCE
nr:L-fucose kinase-like [Rhipicephalus microplus]